MLFDKIKPTQSKIVTSWWYTYICLSEPWTSESENKWQITRTDESWNRMYPNDSRVNEPSYWYNFSATDPTIYTYSYTKIPAVPTWYRKIALLTNYIGMTGLAWPWFWSYQLFLNENYINLVNTDLVYLNEFNEFVAVDNLLATEMLWVTTVGFTTPEDMWDGIYYNVATFPNPIPPIDPYMLIDSNPSYIIMTSIATPWALLTPYTLTLTWNYSNLSQSDLTYVVLWVHTAVDNFLATFDWDNTTTVLFSVPWDISLDIWYNFLTFPQALPYVFIENQTDYINLTATPEIWQGYTAYQLTLTGIYTNITWSDLLENSSWLYSAVMDFSSSYLLWVTTINFTIFWENIEQVYFNIYTFPTPIPEYQTIESLSQYITFTEFNNTRRYRFSTEFSDMNITIYYNNWLAYVPITEHPDYSASLWALPSLYGLGLTNETLFTLTWLTWIITEQLYYYYDSLPIVLNQYQTLQSNASFDSIDWPTGNNMFYYLLWQTFWTGFQLYYKLWVITTIENHPDFQSLQWILSWLDKTLIALEWTTSPILDQLFYQPWN
jgi:hypothetical protein